MRGFKFRRQVVLDRFIADFYCAEAQLRVEVVGPSHDATVERDIAHDAWLAAHGYRTLRVTNADVRDHLEGVLTRIAAACGENTAREGCCLP